MKKRIIYGIVFILLIGLVSGFIVGLRNIKILNTELSNLGYEVVVKDYEGYTLVFDNDEIDADNIQTKIDERLDLIDSLKSYDERVNSGQNGCDTTQWCLDNGWLNNTVCYRGRCIDDGFQSKLDEKLDGIDTTKKEELDSALGIITPK